MLTTSILDKSLSNIIIFNIIISNANILIISTFDTNIKKKYKYIFRPLTSSILLIFLAYINLFLTK